ncbi:MAG TPA: hypothetical protein VHZ74_17595, partial [Bryobacteraceae bacterium]|nr:hypothetical protein [Bryobacteraceae bacterium]
MPKIRDRTDIFENNAFLRTLSGFRRRRETLVVVIKKIVKMRYVKKVEVVRVCRIGLTRKDSPLSALFDSRQLRFEKFRNWSRWIITKMTVETLANVMDYMRTIDLKNRAVTMRA